MIFVRMAQDKVINPLQGWLDSLDIGDDAVLLPVMQVILASRIIE